MDEQKPKKKFKKRYIILAILFIWAIIIVIGNKGKGSSTATIKPTQSTNVDEVTYEDTTLKYVDYEVTTNVADKDVVIVYFDFTNNTKDITSAALRYRINCYQNGIELNMPTLSVVDEQKNITREVKPGTTIRFAQVFYLDDKSVVDLEVEPYITFNGKKLIEKKLTIE